MVKLIIIPGLIMLGCGTVKSKQPAGYTDSVTVHQSSANAKGDTLHARADYYAALPTCIKNKIDSFKRKELHEMPQRVVEYVYRGKKVYYIVMPCCDFFNEVYDDKCMLLGSPDGGFTGKGDGTLPDFFKEATGEKLIWEWAK